MLGIVNGLEVDPKGALPGHGWVRSHLAPGVRVSLAK